MKKFLLSLILTLFIYSLSFAQGDVWSYTKDFATITNPTAICKDTGSNIWFGSKTASAGIVVLNSSGTALSFSPIKTFGTTSITSVQGLQPDQLRIGNIIAIVNGNVLLRINAANGAVLANATVPANGSNTELSNFGIDMFGNIYFTHVTQPAPLQIYDSAFVKVMNVANVATDAPTCMAVTVSNNCDWMWMDGSTNLQGIQVFAGRTGGGSGIHHFRAGMPLDPTTKKFSFSKDSLFSFDRYIFATRGNIESFNWDGSVKSSGSPVITAWVGEKGGKAIKITLGSDLKGNPMVKDSIVISGQITTPRGIVFSSAKVALIADYDKNRVGQFSATPITWNNWHFVKTLQVGTSEITAHGVTIDKKGIIWLAMYSGWDIVSVPGKSLRSILRFNPDFTVKDTIFRLNMGTTYDTLTVASRGIAIDDDGNILYSAGTVLYRINSTTFAGMNKVTPGVGSLTNPAVDRYGHVFLRDVASGTPKGVMIYPKDFNANSIPNIAVAPADVPQIIRSLCVTADGNDIILGSTTGNSVAQFHSDNGSDGPYSFKRWVGAYPLGQTVAFDPNGKLWIGTDDYFRYDCWDLSTMTMIDGISQASTTDLTKGKITNTRGIAFTADGKNIVTVDFAGAVQLWAKGPAAVGDKNQIPENYQIAQNYPNPFNPTTNIQFSLPKASNVNITIYDVFGREVSRLVNNTKFEAGTHNLTWSGKNTEGKSVATGTYFYKFQAAGFEKVMKMMLIK